MSEASTSKVNCVMETSNDDNVERSRLIYGSRALFFEGSHLKNEELMRSSKQVGKGLMGILDHDSESYTTYIPPTTALRFRFLSCPEKYSKTEKVHLNPSP